MFKYQKRYLAHQKRKAKVLANIIATRHSTRQFSDEDIDIKPVLKAIKKSPSSCDRKAVTVKVVSQRDDKDLLAGLLVGGVGWLHRAKYILLIVADRRAYRAGDEIEFMPYLDAGVLIGVSYLTAQANGYGCCYVNPNVRENNKEFFNNRFLDNNLIFCGAIALGKKGER